MKMVRDLDNYIEDVRSSPNFNLPQLEYTTICNADLLPVICNEFVSDYMESNDHHLLLDRSDAVELTRNLCWWLAQYELTCAYIEVNTSGY